MKNTLAQESAISTTVTWGEANQGLRLGLASKEQEVEIHLQNVGTTALEVLSHVAAQENHLDWYTLFLEDEQGQTRQLQLLDNRNRSGIVRVNLEPGEGLQHLINLQDWAGRSINGNQPLEPGPYKVRAVYAVEPDEKHDNWNGRLEAGPVLLAISSSD